MTGGSDTIVSVIISFKTDSASDLKFNIGWSTVKVSAVQPFLPQASTISLIAGAAHYAPQVISMTYPT